MNRIEMLSGGRFLSRHTGATVYHDSRNKIIKVALSEGGFMELVQALQEDGSFKPQMISYVTAQNEHAIIDL